jgi:tetratricopeptide (TPR) repeat protein
MSDPLRTDSLRASDADRDAKIEQLLLAGLDHYFSAHYEQAINVWTRVLFIDRSHARARAYIERARLALAERQRETEELLQSGLAAFERGEGGEARRLLQTALGQGAPQDEALAVLDRLDRLDQAAMPIMPAEAAHVTRRAAVTQVRQVPESHTFRWVIVVATLTAALATAFVSLSWRRPGGHPFAVADLLERFGLFDPGSARATAIPEPSTSLSLPRRGEAAAARAQSLRVSGRLHDALAALDEVRPTDREYPEAERLRADIQRQLIDLASSTAPSRIP